MQVSARVACAGLSDTGRVRQENEDRIYMDPDAGIFLVVDGLGGHAAGERAAEIAVEMVTTRLRRRTGTIVDRIREAIAVANNEIYRLGREHEAYKGMACVLTLAVLEGDDVYVGHVGDSRLYLLQPGSIRRITHDHSPIGEREDAGELSETDAMAHPRRNEVYRDVGSEPHQPDDLDFIELANFPFSPSSALLLCSDGLSDLITADQIRSIVEAHARTPKEAVARLVDAANQAGGKDNVSAILVAGPEYAGRPHRSPLETARPSRSRWILPFLVGLVLAAVAFAVSRPYLRETADGLAVGFGTVRTPLQWTVGPAATLHGIGDALTQARSGDTITVEPGTYRESIVLKDGITLRSRRTREAVIESDGTAVNADNITGARLEGFRITGGGTVGIRLINSDVEVTGAEIDSMRNAGIEIGGDSRAQVRACRISGNPGAGILVHGAARAVIANNVITGNGRVPQHARPGIEIVGSAAPTITGNIVMENGVEQIWVSPLYNAASLFATNVIAPGARDRAKQIRVVTR